jgi:hypothetical protein
MPITRRCKLGAYADALALDHIRDRARALAPTLRSVATPRLMEEWRRTQVATSTC